MAKARSDWTDRNSISHEIDIPTITKALPLSDVAMMTFLLQLNDNTRGRARRLTSNAVKPIQLPPPYGEGEGI